MAEPIAQRMWIMGRPTFRGRIGRTGGGLAGRRPAVAAQVRKLLSVESWRFTLLGLSPRWSTRKRL